MPSADRITQATITRRTFDNLQGSLDRLQRLQEQLSSGKALNRPSDGPVGAVSALRYRAEIDRATQHQRNIDDGLGWLGAADTALTSANDQLQRVRELVLRAVNGSVSAADREAIALEVEGLRESLLGVANTTYLGRPIFGGTTDGAVAFDATGAYVGDAGSVTRSVAPGISVNVNVTGPSAFGDGPSALFATIDEIVADLRSAPQELNADLDALDQAVGVLRSRIAEVGARYRRLEITRDRLDADVVSMRSNLSEVEDIDLPQTVVDLQVQEVAYQVALAATSRVIQPSLVEFLS